jgi:uncharacterized protein YciI
MSTTNHCRYLVIALRTPRFDASVVQSQRLFLDERRRKGRLELTGPFSDKASGVLRAASLADSRAIVARDALSSTGASAICVYEWAAST